MPHALTRTNLAAMRARYATAIGLPRGLVTASLLDDARAAGLAVHAYTYRAEDFGSAAACIDAVAADFDRGVAAVFIDQPDLGAAARDAGSRRGRTGEGAAAGRGA
jgi:glycerophosphoryl diester phosphodiesterase